MWKFIILALLLVVPLSSCGDFENGSAQQGTIDINNVEVIDMQSLLNEAAEAAKFSVFMNSNFPYLPVYRLTGLRALSSVG